MTPKSKTFPEPMPFTARVQTGDVTLTVTHDAQAKFWTMSIEDQVDGRKENRQFSKEGEVAQIVADFCLPLMPGPAFAKAFPFWI